MAHKVFFMFIFQSHFCHPKSNTLYLLHLFTSPLSSRSIHSKAKECRDQFLCTDCKDLKGMCSLRLFASSFTRLDHSSNFLFTFLRPYIKSLFYLEAGVNKLAFPPVFAGEKLLKISCWGRIFNDSPSFNLTKEGQCT